MKILLITGKLAEKTVREYAKKSGINFEVKVMPIEVAAFITPEIIINNLKEDKDRIRNSFDFILVPGLMRGSTEKIESELGMPVFKGPKEAVDIPEIIRAYINEEIRLSKSLPACEYLKEKRIKRFAEEWRAIRKHERELLKKGIVQSIGGSIPIGPNLPIKIIAEIVDAPYLSKEEIVNKTKYYVKSGAHVIDIGMITGEDNSEKISKIIGLIRTITTKPLSIDSLNPNEIIEATKAGIDMIISVYEGNIDEIYRYVANKACILIPRDKSGRVPEDPMDRINLLEHLLEKAKSLGLTNIICDLILNPIHVPSLLNSIIAFREFSIRNPNLPLMMGVANVTELIDADSPGINALMAGIASELGVSMILTTEHSDKTRGSVQELSVAVKMMYISKMKRIPPKNLGLDLLLLKEKRKSEIEYYDLEKLARTVFYTNSAPKHYEPDPRGFFRIFVDRRRNEIVVLHFPKGEKKPDVVIRGRNVSAIFHKLIALGLVSNLSHAAYIGTELEKAYIAIKTQRSYVQDREVF